MFNVQHSNNQMENIKVDVSDKGTWSKHLTLHLSICIMPLIVEILPKLHKFQRSTQICMRTNRIVQTECPSLASPALSKPHNPPMY